MHRLSPEGPPCSVARNSAGMSQSKRVQWELPSHLKCGLEGWGRLAKQQVVQASAAVLPSPRRSAVAVGNRIWRVATDCSGADAPIWSLRLMQVPHAHVYASDIWPMARDFIALNSKPSAEICTDMCARKLESVPAHDVYVCGFPCQPFSLLHHGTTFFQEAKSRPFRAMLRQIRHSKALVVVLENVCGILRVLQKLRRSLASLREYQWIIMKLDPRMFGQPVRRPRIYIVGIRQDVSIVESEAEMKDVTQKILDRVKLPRLDLVKDVLLPGTHLRISADHKSSQNSAASRPGSLQRLSAKQRERWADHSRRHGARVNADVSQSPGRIPSASPGILPTVTPQGRVVVGALSRELLPLEKMIVHGLPVHKMVAPPRLTNAQIGRLGGNTMDVRCVGVAMMLGMSMVEAAPSSSRQPRKTFVCMLDGPRRSLQEKSAGADRRTLHRKGSKQSLGKRVAISHGQARASHKSRKITSAGGTSSNRGGRGVGQSSTSAKLMDLF